MAEPLIYVSRLRRLPLLDNDGMTLGGIDDVVVAPAYAGGPPRVIGFVASVQRRRIFLNANRIGELDARGARLHGGTIDVQSFTLRPGELLATAVIGRKVTSEVVLDIGLNTCADRGRGWEVHSVLLGSSGFVLVRRPTRTVPWQEVAVLFDTGPVGREVAAMRQMHPADVAREIVRLPLAKRRLLAEAMEDEDLANLLEEMPEPEQLRIIEGLDLERAAHVLEEMEPDDAADLLAEMTKDQRRDVLEAMEPDEAAPIRRLLLYGGDTAGGLMTPEPVVLPPTTTVAEALARVRKPDTPVALAAHVFVTEAPTTTPTGTYLGVVGLQRLLREPPSMPLGRCLDAEPRPITPSLPSAQVARRLASYNLVAVPVCDEAGRLVGAVTVDDVLERVLNPGPPS